MTTFSPEQINKLKSPLDRQHVASREQGGRQVSYVEGWHVIDEANQIFGFDAWDRETILLQETNRDLLTLKGKNGDYQQWRVGYLAKVRITVGSVIREGTGFGTGMSKPEALGEAIESAVKEAETDAMKRALMTFGNPFGLALYDKTQSNVADEADIARQSAIESLWLELSALSSPGGLKSFWIDNSKAIAGFDEFNRNRFTKRKDELKARFDADKDVAAIQDQFPGAKVTDVRSIEDTFPGDLPFSDDEVRRNPINAG